jgi:hypothetical protein
VAFCPSFCRGLAFVGGKGGGRPFQSPATKGPSSASRSTSAEGARGRAALRPRSRRLVLVDPPTEWLTMKGGIKEIYDVVFLPGIRQPSAVGFKTDEIKATVTIEPQAESSFRP